MQEIVQRMLEVEREASSRIASADAAAAKSLEEARSEADHLLNQARQDAAAEARALVEKAREEAGQERNARVQEAMQDLEKQFAAIREKRECVVQRMADVLLDETT